MELYGKSSGRSRLRMRTSIGSIPSASATPSIARSIVRQAAERATPRYAPKGDLFVATL
jgi:hypothetical protein